MISTENLTLGFGGRTLFENVNVKFTPGNAYGLIGANGAGKSTFLRCLSGQQTVDKGQVTMAKDLRLSCLEQDHFKYNEERALDTVIQGHERLWSVMREKEAIYMKPDFSDEDGIRAAELETDFADMDGWEAEANASRLLENLNIPTSKHELKLSELADNEKIRVLLAKALFGNPDVLLLDEPTNHLDVDSILWLEEFLLNFRNTLIVVSHDRHFLDKVCTHIADVDFQTVSLYTGNYSFWYHTSQLALEQRRADNKKKEEKVRELRAFIQRFSANASKSKQATSRRNLLDKINLDEIKPSNRKYPYIVFKPERELGNDVLFMEGASKKEGDTVYFKNVDLQVRKGEKVILTGPDYLKTRFMDVLAGESSIDGGELRWGRTTNVGYMPKDIEPFFETDKILLDWLHQYAVGKDMSELRGFLGRMLFSGDEVKKKVSVLSGGEKMRCMFSRIMLQDPNVVILDTPTSHLDLESITALNEALENFSGALIFASDDTQFCSTLATRVVELRGSEYFDLRMDYKTYLKDESRLEREGRVFS